MWVLNLVLNVPEFLNAWKFETSTILAPAQAIAAASVKLSTSSTTTIEARLTSKLPGSVRKADSLRTNQAGLGMVCTRAKPWLLVMAAQRYNNYDPYDDVEVDLPPEKMLKKGDPGTYQATIKGVMPVGYWVTMPSGREAYLPAQDLGFLGGLEKLRKIFKEGDEVTVRVVTRGGSGREVLSLKIPDPNKPDPPPKPLRKEFLPGGAASRRRRYQQ